METPETGSAGELARTLRIKAQEFARLASEAHDPFAAVGQKELAAQYEAEADELAIGGKS